MDQHPLFNNIEYVGFIGEGTYGTVKGYKLSNGDRVAVKNIIIHNSIDSESLAEINALKVLDGKPHIVQLLDIRINGVLSIDIMMKQYSGSLKQFIELINQKDRVGVFNDVTDQLLKGLYYINTSYITHRDIKPGNILVDFNFNQETGELLKNPTCYYADFGLSSQLLCTEKVYESRSSYICTPGYKSPEILNREEVYLYQPDIRALGITLLNYLTNDVHIYNDNEDNEEQELQYIYSLSNNTKTGIDVVSILNKHGIIIDYHYIKMLEKMLLFDMNTRVKITELIHPTIFPTINTLPPRGKVLNTDITLDFYYQVLEWGFSIAMGFKLSITAFVIATDLFERYLSNYTSDIGYLNALYLACLSIGSKTGDCLEIDLSLAKDYTDNTLDELEKAEVLVIESVNYRYMSCDIKEILEKLVHYPYPYIPLSKLYTLLKLNKIYSSSVSYKMLASLIPEYIV